MVSTKHLLDPELQVMADGPFLPELNDENLNKARANMASQAVGLADPDSFVLSAPKYLPHSMMVPTSDVCFMRQRIRVSPLQQGTSTSMAVVTCLVLLTVRICLIF